MARLEASNISKEEYSIACTLYNNTIIEQQNPPLTLEDIRVVDEGSQGAVDFLMDKVRNRNIR